MTEKILFNDEAREKVKEGVDLVADTVKVSLGAKGKNVVIGGGKNAISKDGFSIAKSIQFSDPLKSIGAELIKKVSKKTVEISGDGTSSATVLAQEIIKEGFKLLSKGYHGQEIKEGIDMAVAAVVMKLKTISEDVTINSQRLLNIATTSGNNDEALGLIVAEAFAKTGKDGVITLDDSKTGETYLSFKEGMTFERGYLNPLFINNQANLSCQLNNPYIIVAEGKITSLKEINPILQLINQEKREVLIIAEDFDGEALYTINANRAKNNFPICLVKAPAFGDNQKQVLKDLAAVVGANVANDESGLRLDTLKLTDLGSAEKVNCLKDETTIVGGAGKKQDIEERIRFIRKSIELNDANDWFGKQQLEQRLAKLTGGIAIIYVGAATETELSELKDRYDDAVRACQSALSEGVVVGGGIALIRCIDTLWTKENKLIKWIKEVFSFGSKNGKEAGIKLVQSILRKPFEQMSENADLSHKVKVKHVLDKPLNFGYNFKTDNYEDLMQSGVVDPLKVVRVALVNAASFAGTLLTTAALIVPEKQEAPAFIPPHLR